MKKLIFTMLGLTLLLTSCSKEGGKTQAKLSLSLGGITNLTSSYGAGGTILFGRSATGELFGKVVAGSEENLILPNGDWTFYAFMWEGLAAGSTTLSMMNGKVRCAKTMAKLGGTDVTLNFNLTNSNCTDPEFSNGKINQADASGIRFADIFLDECDEIITPNSPNATATTITPWHCGIDNQGSAVSYRVKFQGFNKKDPSTPFMFNGEVIVGACKLANKTTLGAFNKGLDINFPTGNGMFPFVASVEMFLGSTNCDPAEAKGMHQVFFDRGFGVPANPYSKMIESNKVCNSFSTPEWPADAKLKELKCYSLNGSWNNGDCAGLPASTMRFAPVAECSNQSDATWAIKHQVSIPKPILCGRYDSKSVMIGAHPFAGGNGSIERPYKICNEWQINQIGEYDSDISYSNKIYKLMNDLDMNKTDAIANAPYENPKCVGVIDAQVENHHNLNPLDKINYGNCTTLRTNENNGFQGLFLGNNKTIRNARISAEDVSDLGFVRQMWSGSAIRNLNFVNLEVRGNSNVGGIVGNANSITNLTKIKIVKLDVEGNSNNGVGGDKVGGVVGNLGSDAVLADVRVIDGRLHGRNNLGGIVGFNSGGKLIQVGFSGVIDHWDNNTATYVGGLIGYTQGTGLIEKSFSEGVINSSANYTGGLVGKVNTGSINGAYSTMVVSSRYQNSSAQVGGLVGYSSGVINDVFFDGVVDYSGGGPTPVIDPIGSNANGGNCFSSATSSAACHVPITYANLRSATMPAFSSTVGWVKTAGTLPRFAWEQRACALIVNNESVASQIASGRGTVLNPVIICNSTQLAAVTGNYNYVLGEDLNLSNWTSSSMITQFDGVLDGRGSFLYGLNLNMSGGTAEKVGIFRQNNGSIANLRLAGNTINNIDGSDPANGLLVGSNIGKIFKVGFFGNKLSAPNQVGLVAGENTSSTAVIDNVNIQQNRIDGTINVGSVAGYNSGNAKIIRVSSDAEIHNLNTGYYAFGGIAGGNAGGIIDQTEFGGRIEFNMSTTSPTTSPMAGGIVGVNDIGGVVSNSYTESHSTLKVMNANNVGGLVGVNYNTNAGAINHSFALGKVIFDSANTIAVGSSFHPLIGNLASPTSADLFYLQNNIASRVGNTNIDSCAGSYPSYTANAATGLHATLTTTAPVNFANAFSYSNMGGGDLASLITLAVTGTDYVFTFSGDNCYPGPIELFQKFNPNFTGGAKTVANFGDINLFLNNGFDIAYEDRDVPANSIKQDALIEFYMARMENRVPKLPPPIWEHESGEDHPRLLQVNH